MKWNIGGLEIGGRAVLGPMQGYSCGSYREFNAPYGVSLAFTEMVSDKGIIHGDAGTLPYLAFRHSVPTALQIFGSDAEQLQAAAAKALALNPSISAVDINMGCPVHKVTRNGGGSRLMRDPVKCGEIVRGVKRCADVPVTAKIRLGWDRCEMNFREVISEVQAAGADCISVHARTAQEKYGGRPDYMAVEGLRKEMCVPLIISGNIYCLDDAIYARKRTGAEGVMVSRGGLGNPFLFRQISAWYSDGIRLPEPTVQEQVDRCIEFAGMLVREKGEETAVRKLRSFAPRFISGCMHGRAYRNRLAAGTRSLADLYSVLEEIRSELGDERTVPAVGLPGDATGHARRGEGLIPRTSVHLPWN